MKLQATCGRSEVRSLCVHGGTEHELGFGESLLLPHTMSRSEAGAT